MTMDSAVIFASLTFGSLPVALVTLLGFTWFTNRQDRRRNIDLAKDHEDIIFLFDDETLVNATASAQTVLNAVKNPGSDWVRLQSVLISRFPTLQTEISKLAHDGQLTIPSNDDNAVLKCNWHNGLARVELIDGETGDLRVDRHSLSAMERELGTLRSMAENLPYLVWRESENGVILWANSAYLSLSDQMSQDLNPVSWPPAALFEKTALNTTNGTETRRLSLAVGDTTRWFEVNRFDVNDGYLYTASAADRTVKAEDTLREFTQTLTKTFSHLTIGLAVFDRNRKLALFNPALTDLIALPIDFMITRPPLTAFLDRLRDRQMMPEPKDYKSWRQHISELETAAQDGTYEELWPLPGGITYRVTGRPHPDGAIAFLFEDISAEMSLTRRFRSEIETGQAVLDSMDEAVAVFSSDGLLMMSNQSYATLWGLEDLDGIAEMGIHEASKLWHAKCAPSPLWASLNEFVAHAGDRKPWAGTTRLWDGRRLKCRFVPLGRGQTLVGFTPEARPLSQRPLQNPKAVERILEA